MGFELVNDAFYPPDSTDPDTYSIAIDIGTTIEFIFQLTTAQNVILYLMFPELPEGCQNSRTVLVNNLSFTAAYDQTGSWIQVGPISCQPGTNVITIMESSQDAPAPQWPPDSVLCYISNVMVGDSQINLQSWFNDPNASLADWINIAPPSGNNYEADFVEGSYFQGPVYNFGTGDFTLEAWVTTTSGGPVFTLTGPAAQSVGQEYLLLAVQSDGTVFVGCRDSETGMVGIWTLSDDQAILDGEPHHLAMVRQGTVITIYLDGDPLSPAPFNIQPAGTIDLSSVNVVFVGFAIMPPTISQPGDPFVAWTLDSYYFVGQMDEVRFWSIALSQGLIADGMHHELTNTEPGLVGHWTFDNQDGTDSSPLGNNLSPTVSMQYQLSEVDFEPPGQPYLITQVQLMEDYISDNTQPSGFNTVNGYRVVISARDGFGNPYFPLPDTPTPTMISIWGVEPAELVFMDGTSASVGPSTPCIRPLDSMSELTFVIDSQSQITCPVLRVNASFMAEYERLVISPDRHVHAILANVTGDQLAGNAPLPSGKTAALGNLPSNLSPDLLDNVASVISNVMSAAVPHSVQPERPLTRTRDLPLDEPVSPPYEAMYQNLELLTSPYDFVSNMASAHYLQTDGFVLRILAPESMPTSLWQYDFTSNSFTPLTDAQRSAMLDPLSVAHQDNYAVLFAGNQSVSLTNSQLIYTANQIQTRSVSSFEDWLSDAESFVVTTVEAAVDQVAGAVKTIVVTAIKDAETAVDFVLQTVEDAASFVAAFLGKLGVTIGEIVDFVTSLFSWSDILQTQNGLQQAMLSMQNVLKSVANSAQSRIIDAIQSCENEINSQFDQWLEKVGNTSLADQSQANANNQPQSIQARYLHSLLASNMSAIAPNAVNPISDLVSQQVLNGLRSTYDDEALNSLSTALNGTGIQSYFTNPHNLFQELLSNFLQAVRSLVLDFLNLIQGGVNLLFGAIDSLIDEMFALATTRIDIPLLTPFYENVVMQGNGNKMSLLSLVSLAAAIPVTAAYKAMSGGQPLFSAQEIQDLGNPNWSGYTALVSQAQGIIAGTDTQETVAQAAGEASAATAPALLQSDSGPEGQETITTMQKVSWCFNFFYASSTLVWGLACVVEDTVQEAPAVIVRTKLISQFLTLGSGFPLLVNYGDTGPKLTIEFVIWGSEFLPFFSNVGAAYNQPWNQSGDPIATGVYGCLQFIAYLDLYVQSLIQAGTAFDLDSFITWRINCLDSLEWIPQLAKLNPAYKWAVPLLDAAAYAGVGFGTGAYTLAQMGQAD